MSQYEDDGPMSTGSISEANAKTPRRVRFDDTNARVLRVTLIIALLGFLGCAWVACTTFGTIRTQELLRHEGSMSDGIVTESTPNHGGVHLKYRFEIDGVWYGGQAEMKANHYRAPTPGETIPILYLPNKPKVNLPRGWGWFSMWDMFPYLFLLFTMIAPGFVIAEVLRERYLARMGVVVEGRVTGCDLNRKPFKVYYEFTTQESTAMEGSTDSTDEQEVGASIPIIYLRSNPRRNDRFPVGGFRIAE